MATIAEANEVLSKLVREHGAASWLRSITIAGQAGEYEVQLRVRSDAPGLPTLVDGVTVHTERLSTDWRVA